MTQFFFNRNTIDNLKFYVYGLKDPFTNKYFYIGKGKANRVFSHVNQKIKRGIDDQKYEKIKDNLFATVKFVAEVISVKRDKENKIIEGNPDKIKFVSDNWKFTRNVNQKSPNWYLSEIIS